MVRVKNFGNTDLKVSEIGLGCARLGGMLAQNQGRGESPLTLLNKAFEAGITLFDTADMYTQGESETLIGQAFRTKRDKIVIASKGGYCLPAQRKLLARVKPLIRPLARALGISRGSLPSSVSGTISQDFSSAYLSGAVEASLRRLQTDYLDLYQLHSPPGAAIAAGEWVETLEKLKEQGKIRYYGIAVDTIEEALQCLPYSGIASVMAPFGLLDPEALDTFFAQAEARKLAVIARGCFGGGLLNPDLTEQQLKKLAPNKWQQVLTYRQVAERQGRSVLEMALQFSLSMRPVSVTLLGMRTETHLRTNLAYLNSPALTEEEITELASGRKGNQLRSLILDAG